MSKERKSYHQIIRSTGIFGGAQVVNILIGVIRNKIIAILLGTLGIGLISMYQSAIDLIKSISSLGIETTGVKEIASVTENKEDLTLTISIIKRWSLILAVFGALLCILFCYPISTWAFESTSYSLQIALLSICVFFGTLAAGEVVILQGMRKISYMVKSVLIWNSCGLILSIPLYYYYRNQAIIPVFIIVSIAMYLSAYYYRRKLKFESISISHTVVLKKGISILRVGFFIVLAAIQSQLSFFIIRTVIAHHIGISSVGLFQATWTVSNVYLMLVLRSMGADFYPRLSTIANHHSKTRRLVNEQTYIVLVASVPLIILLLLSSKLILSILYSFEFMSVATLLNWQTLGTFFKVLSWPLGFILLAKGKGLLFFISESIFSVIYIASIYILLPFFGLEALGIGYLISYIVYLLTVYLMGRKLSNFRWLKKNIVMSIISLALILCSFYIVQYQSGYTVVLGIPILIVSVIYSLYKLNKVLPLTSVLKVFKD